MNNAKTLKSAFDIEVREGVLTVWINRPASLNALRSGDKLELATIIEGVAPDVRVILIRGVGTRAFCAGADIKELAKHSVGSGVASLSAEARLFDAFLRCPLPIVAMVNGYALGLGLIIACVCDVILATEDAVFGMPEVRNSVPAGMQTQLLVDIIGLNRARYLLYTGAQLSAATAREAGLVSEILPDLDAIEARAGELAATLKSLPKEGLALQKRVVDSWIRNPFNANIEGNLYLAASAFGDATPANEIGRFLAKKSGS
ncbi:enoyl-CoA hydratase [Acrocarpospora macrocephala]|uniref:Enoyl-CoA hydratase n=1 Tax=Acrocarpospora macrocephala TaxID=150177 RepID=A0A5M3X0V2_9ACTN|nr:enoyl-CoA hydratase [Acrocarpospora macrocephala]